MKKLNILFIPDFMRWKISKKMINCGNPSFGGTMYGCPQCGKLKFVPFRCHSRFCPTCGNKYSIERTTGYIMVLHTFGRDLKWNPHIHCLIFEGGYSDNGGWHNITHFNYTYLRNAFRTALLNETESRLDPSFKKIKALCYLKYKHCFYVYAKPNKCDPKTVVAKDAPKISCG